MVSSLALVVPSCRHDLLHCVDIQLVAVVSMDMDIDLAGHIYSVLGHKVVVESIQGLYA